MQSLGCLALALLQDDGGLARNVHWMTIFLGIVAAAVVIGFLGMCVAGIKLLQLMIKAEALAERLEGKFSPMLDKTHALVEELGPKVRTITTNAEQISYTVRSKVDEFGATADELNRTVKDVNKRTQAQVARVDGIVGEALHSAQNVSRTVQESVRKPVQQIAGIIAGVKKAVETWADRSPFKRPEPTEEYRPYEAPPRYTTTKTEYTTTTTESKRTTPYG
jgi:methyl-accepting chemotaxis protein